MIIQSASDLRARCPCCAASLSTSSFLSALCCLFVGCANTLRTEQLNYNDYYYQYYCYCQYQPTSNSNNNRTRRDCSEQLEEEGEQYNWLANALLFLFFLNFIIIYLFYFYFYSIIQCVFLVFGTTCQQNRRTHTRGKEDR